MINFDVQTQSKASELIGELVDRLRFDEPYEQSYETANKSAFQRVLEKEGVMLHCRHLTSCFDSGASFRHNGLLCWSDLLEMKDAPLTKVLDCCGITHTPESGFLLKGKYDSRIDLNGNLSYLKKDNCINSYLHCFKNNENYCESPEILRTLSKAIKNSTLREAVEKWTECSTKICVSFDVSIDAVDVLPGYYPLNNDCTGSIYSALVEVLFAVLERSDTFSSKIILKRGVSIPPEKLVVSSMEKLDWDF